MAKGNKIVVSPHPKGVEIEGTINGALKPGTVVQIDVSEGIDTGTNRMQWEAYAPGTDGDQRLIAVLLPDRHQGKLATDAYVSGDQCFVYVPVAGEQLNMLYLDIAGTGDDHAFGDVMMVDTSTGKLIATTGTPESEPFTCLEAATDPTADSLLHSLYTGY
tara:strand:+ start:20519 stop:21001 length:483 start_codon:yes stop_codon:yes gene_type:complete